MAEALVEVPVEATVEELQREVHTISQLLKESRLIELNLIIKHQHTELHLEQLLDLQVIELLQLVRHIEKPTKRLLSERLIEDILVISEMEEVMDLYMLTTCHQITTTSLDITPHCTSRFTIMVMDLTFTIENMDTMLVHQTLISSFIAEVVLEEPLEEFLSAAASLVSLFGAP